MQQGTPAGGMATISSPDTVLFTRVDTVFQTRTLRKPVYIVRYEKPGTETRIPKDTSPGDTQASDLAGNTDNTGVSSTGEVPTPKGVKPAGTPSIAQSNVPEPASYIQQYTNMVTSLEKINLSNSDRVRE
jgi:hypothetical protein